jgi:hypothetical protein
MRISPKAIPIAMKIRCHTVSPPLGADDAGLAGSRQPPESAAF